MLAAIANADLSSPHSQSFSPHRLSHASYALLDYAAWKRKILLCERALQMIVGRPRLNKSPLFLQRMERRSAPISTPYLLVYYFSHLLPLLQLPNSSPPRPLLYNVLSNRIFPCRSSRPHLRSLLFSDDLSIHMPLLLLAPSLAFHLSRSAKIWTPNPSACF